MVKADDTRYYNKELDIDGTADELFQQVSLGYFDDNPEAMDKISEFLDGEGKEHQARYVRANIALCEEESYGVYSDDHAVAFYAFLAELEMCKSEGCPKDYKVSLQELQDDYEMDDETFSNVTINGSYNHDDDTVIFSVSESNPEYSKDNAVKFPYDKVKDWTAEDFDKAMNEILYYAPVNYETASIEDKEGEERE